MDYEDKIKSVFDKVLRDSKASKIDWKQSTKSNDGLMVIKGNFEIHVTDSNFSIYQIDGEFIFGLSDTQLPFSEIPDLYIIAYESVFKTGKKLDELNDLLD